MKTLNANTSRVDHLIIWLAMAINFAMFSGWLG